MILLVCLFAVAAFSVTNAKAEEYYDDASGWVEPVAYSNPYSGSWNNCTWSAWQLTYQTYGIALPDWGSAGNWLNNAMNQGYTVSSVPVAGSIVVWSHHVGLVTAVSEDGSSVYIIEGGYCGGYHEGWFPAYYSRSSQKLLGYIYLGW